MRIGLNATALVAKASIEAFVEHAQAAETDGFDSYWVAEHPTGGLDALTVLTVVGQSVSRMELGTAVIPTYPRHPMVLAGQAMSAQSAMEGRLTLGIGLSHQPMMAELGTLGWECTASPAGLPLKAKTKHRRSFGGRQKIC